MCEHTPLKISVFSGAQIRNIITVQVISNASDYLVRI